ncbi:hypothetical protein CTU88_31285 [Streptomyces sp. JV178]|nr:hypothetical protein CTU88_31285 [Streptomyces sp. JV178]
MGALSGWAGAESSVACMWSAFAGSAASSVLRAARDQALPRRPLDGETFDQVAARHRAAPGRGRAVSSASR